VIEPRTEAGRTGLAALRADPAHALIALDYDGTLAPIVADPTAAVPAPGAVEQLARLGGRVGGIAVITGRPAEVAVSLGGLQHVPGLLVLGQYGVERWRDGELSSPTPAPGIAAARTELGPVVQAAGASLEDKELSLVVHTRTAPLGALEQLAEPVATIARRTGLELHLGRMVLELRPPGFDKYGALLSAADPRPSAVLFAGDDIGDGAAYDAVDELRAVGVPGLTVFSDSSEGPADLRDRADVVVDGPQGVVALLSELL
jgi:trehalose 6-phosphate phosphatase